jgi:hypothetical protein
VRVLVARGAAVLVAEGRIDKRQRRQRPVGAALVVLLDAGGAVWFPGADGRQRFSIISTTNVSIGRVRGDGSAARRCMRAASAISVSGPSNSPAEAARPAVTAVR